MIISVGYRVKSQNGILFRKWATSVLKDYMLKGYAVNQKSFASFNTEIEMYPYIHYAKEQTDFINIIERNINIVGRIRNE